MSSLDDEETGAKLQKIKLEPGQEMEVCIMLLKCCSQEKIYLDYYGHLGQQFCKIKKFIKKNFETCFAQYYSKIDRLETTKIRNVARFFAHLLAKDVLPWRVLAYIRLTEEDTTSSSRIFIKILFKELARRLGISQLNKRLSDPSMKANLVSIFPQDDPKNTRFSINFFTCNGLGGITENLSKYLEMPRSVSDRSKNSDSSGLESKKSSSIESKRKSESGQKPASDQSKNSDSSGLRSKKSSSIESKRKRESDQKSLIVQQKPASDQSKKSDSSSLGSKKSSSIESKRKSESDQKSRKRPRSR